MECRSRTFGTYRVYLIVGPTSALVQPDARPVCMDDFEEFHDGAAAGGSC